MYKNLVIISIDSLRYDGTNYNRRILLSNDQPKIKTPNLDQFSKNGTTFVNAYSTNTYTTSAHASLFTGRYPTHHGIRAFFDFNQKLNTKHETLAEILNKKNFQTFFYSDVKELFSMMDIWRGFRVRTDRKMSWLWNSIDTLKKDRNFIFIHTFDVHEPYLFVEDQSENKNINEEYFDLISDLKKHISMRSKINQRKKPHDAWGEIRKYLVDQKINQAEVFSESYYKGIEKFDKNRLSKIFRNLDALGINQQNTFFVLLSDHGEGKTEFSNNLNFGHSGELTEETLRIYLSTSKLEKSVDPDLFSMTFVKDLALNQLRLGKSKKEYFEFKKNLFSKEKFIYAESFIYYLSDTNPQMTDNVDRVTNMNNKYRKTDHLIYNRGFISNKSKIIVKNRPEKVHELYKLPKYADLINKGFHYILGRDPDKLTYKNLLKKLKNRHINKRDFINILLESEEKKLKPFLMYFTDKMNEDLKKRFNYNKLSDKIEELVEISIKATPKDITSLKKFITK